jgi:hypothetical protein
VFCKRVSRLHSDRLPHGLIALHNGHHVLRVCELWNRRCRGGGARPSKHEVHTTTTKTAGLASAAASRTASATLAPGVGDGAAGDGCTVGSSFAAPASSPLGGQCDEGKGGRRVTQVASRAV